MSVTDEQKGGLSLATFLTDGGLARLCAEIQSLIGVQVQLRDERGRRVEFGGGDRPWTINESDSEDTPDVTAFPLTVDGQIIGRITLAAGAPELGPAARERAENVLRLVAATASELCADVLELRHRIIALEVLYRLSSLLVSGFGVEEVLQSTLDSALEALELDKGSIVLLPHDADGLPARDDEAELELVASRGLSQGWLTNPLPLSQKRIFDRRVLAGEVVSIADLQKDPDVLVPERCAEEGVVSFISAGLVFRKRLIGVIRLYGSQPRKFSDQDRTLLRSIGQQAGAAVNQANLLRIQQEEQRIQRQLSLASDIQARMLPQKMPKIPGFEVAARCEPCFELGGDFYDLIEHDGTLGVVIGDVVGKGVAAALLMAAVRSSLRAYADHVSGIDAVLSRVNDALCRDTLMHEFATIWFGVFDRSRGELTFGSAGHDPPLLARPDGDGSHRIQELRASGLVVGVLEDQHYEQKTCKLQTGDVLVAYTDGVTDAADFEGKRYSRQRLCQSLGRILDAEPDASAERILDHLRWDVRRFTGLSRQRDDETLVVVRLTSTTSE